MSEIIKLRGGAAFSASRLARLTEQAHGVVPSLGHLLAEHYYFIDLKAPLSAAEIRRLNESY